MKKIKIVKICMFVVVIMFLGMMLGVNVYANDPNDWTIGGNNLGSTGVLGTTSNQDLQIITNNAQRINIMANGDIGIGVAAPSNKVDINDADTTAGRVGLNVLQNGAISGTGYGIYVEKLGASTTNVAGYFSATQATNNYGLIVENGDVGIGTTSPGAQLDVRGNAIFNEDGSDYDFRIEGDTNSNLFFVDASADKIGIGTTSPGAQLDVRGSAIFNEDGGDYDFRIEGDTNSNLFFVDASTNKIGIGTTTPDNLLSIYGDTPIVDIETSDNDIIDGDDLGMIQFRGLDATQTHLVGAMIRAEAADTWDGDDKDNAPTELQFFTEDNTPTDHLATPRLVISQTGNVGIGTTSPGGKLEIRNDESSSQSSIKTTLAANAIIIDTDYTVDNYMPGIVWNTNNNNDGKPKAGIWVKETTSGTYMRFGTSDTYTTGITDTQLSITPAGLIGIDIGSPNSKLHIHEDSGANPVIRLTGTNYGGTNGVTIRLDNTDGSLDFGTGQPASTQVTIDINGNVGIGIATPQNTLHLVGTLRYDCTTGQNKNTNPNVYLPIVVGGSQYWLKCWT